MRKTIKWVSISIVSLILILLIALTIYSSNPYTALPEMNEAIALIDDSTVTYYEDNEEIRYTVANPLKHIIFIPGGLVTPDSYKYLALNIALQGYDVVIVKAVFNLPILNPGIGKKFLSDSLENVIIGHSLGGITASKVFGGNDLVDSIIFLGSYPIQDVSDQQTLFITADFDLGMDPVALSDSLKYVNEDNIMINITGGNHAQFGWYGLQKDDGEATISTMDQQNIVVQTIVDFIK